MERDEIGIKRHPALGRPDTIVVAPKKQIGVAQPFQVIGRMKRIEADRAFDRLRRLFGAVRLAEHRSEIAQCDGISRLKSESPIGFPVSRVEFAAELVDLG